MRFQVLFFLGVLSCSSSFSLDIFSLTLSDIPNRSGGCSSVAALFSEKLKAGTQVEIYEARVVAATRRRCRIEINYLAEKELDHVESIDVSLQSPGWQGTYEKREDCETDLPRQVQLFKSATGIDPWASYCKWSSFELEHRPFLAHVLGAGDTKMRMLATKSTFLYSPIEGWDAVRLSLAQAIAEKGVKLANLVFQPSTTLYEGLLTHYGAEREDRLWLTDVTFAIHTWDAVCLTQIGDARRFLEKLSPKPIGVFCSKGYTHEYAFQIIFAQPEILPPATFKVIADPKQFPSLGACFTAKSEIEAFYRNKLGKNILGSVCAGAVDRVQVHLIDPSGARAKL